MSYVVDASVVTKALASEAGSDAASEVMKLPLIAPDLLAAECLNALRKKVLRGVLTADQAAALAQVLERAPIIFEHSQPVLARALELSLRLSHSVYDCVYLALAERFSCVLITADDKLVSRCRQPDAPELFARVRALSEPLPSMVQERVFRPYMARRKAA